MATEPFQVGQVLMFSHGEYSDYVCGLVRVLKPIDSDAWEKMVEAGMEDWGAGNRHFSYSTAVAWLIAQGYAEDIECRETHLGAYGTPPTWGDA